MIFFLLQAEVPKSVSTRGILSVLCQVAAVTIEKGNKILDLFLNWRWQLIVDQVVQSAVLKEASSLWSFLRGEMRADKVISLKTEYSKSETKAQDGGQGRRKEKMLRGQ